MAKKLGTIKKKAWAIFSKYIRLKASDENGNCKCVTCGTIKPIKEMQAGHFIGGRNNAVLFNEMGVNPQCYGCNVGKKGNYIEYFIYMENEHGREEINKQRIEAKKAVKYTYNDYQDIYEKYLGLYRGLGGE